MIRANNVYENSEYTVKYWSAKKKKKTYKVNYFKSHILTTVKGPWDKIIIEFSMVHYTNFEAIPL